MFNIIYFYTKCENFGVKNSMKILVQRNWPEKDYMLQFPKKLKLCTKLFLRKYMKKFRSKFIFNSFCLLFVSFIICLRLTTKLSSATGTSH